MKDYFEEAKRLISDMTVLLNDNKNLDEVKLSFKKDIAIKIHQAVHADSETSELPSDWGNFEILTDNHKIIKINKI